jgi:HEAT repeat protein
MRIWSGHARWSSALAALFALGVLLVLWADDGARETDAADALALPSDSASDEGSLEAPEAVPVEMAEAAAAKERSGGTLSEPSGRRDVGEETMGAEAGSEQERVVEELVEALEDPDARVFADAVDALSKRDRKRLVSVLELQLEEGPASEGSDDSESRSRAAWELGVEGGEDAVDPLIRAFEGTDPAVREAAAYGLARTGSDRALDFILEAAEGSDPERKRTAISALAFEGDEEARSDLADAYDQGLITPDDIPDDALEELLLESEGAGCQGPEWVYPSCRRALIVHADGAGEESGGGGIPDDEFAGIDGNCAGSEWRLPECSRE